MRDEPDPAHPRPPEIALAARGRHGDLPDARAQDGGRQVVPDFRHEDEAADARDRHEAEIAEIDLLPGQEREQPPVQGIPDFERLSLRPFGALGDNDVPRPLAANSLGRSAGRSSPSQSMTKTPSRSSRRAMSTRPTAIAL